MDASCWQIEAATHAHLPAAKSAWTFISWLLLQPSLPLLYGTMGCCPRSCTNLSARSVPTRAQNWTRTFFSQTFRAPPGYPSKIPGYPAKKVWFPWFRGAYRTFWPPPLHVEDPHPTRKYPDSKVWVWVPFSCLTNDPWLWCFWRTILMRTKMQKIRDRLARQMQKILFVNVSPHYFCQLCSYFLDFWFFLFWTGSI